MGWVVFCKRDGEMLRYYDTESKARAQVKGHNKKLSWAVLTNTNRMERREWDCCEWGEYEKVFNDHYQLNRGYWLQRSSYK